MFENKQSLNDVLHSVWLLSGLKLTKKNGTIGQYVSGHSAVRQNTSEMALT